MKTGSLTRLLSSTMIAGLLLSSTPSIVSAQSHDGHAGAAAQVHKPGPFDAALAKAVRDATEKYRKVSDAMRAGYGLMFGCVSGGDYGAMGLHFVKGDLVFDGELNVATPEIVLYEPLPNGRARITGADYLVLAADWNAKHPEGPPQLMGQLFHYFESPNRFGLPPFYTLHVWAWKGNPDGTFTNWNRDVSCDAFNPQTPISDK
jgi:hypothetical protein